MAVGKRASACSLTVSGVAWRAPCCTDDGLAAVRHCWSSCVVVTMGNGPSPWCRPTCQCAGSVAQSPSCAEPPDTTRHWPLAAGIALLMIVAPDVESWSIVHCSFVPLHVETVPQLPSVLSYRWIAEPAEPRQPLMSMQPWSGLPPASRRTLVFSSYSNCCILLLGSHLVVKSAPWLLEPLEESPGQASNIMAWNCASMAVAGRSALRSMPSERQSCMRSVLLDSPTASPKVTEAMESSDISACVAALRSWSVQNKQTSPRVRNEDQGGAETDAIVSDLIGLHPLKEGHCFVSLVHSPDFCVEVAFEMNVSLYGNRPRPDQWKALSGPICAAAGGKCSGQAASAMGGKQTQAAPPQLTAHCTVGSLIGWPPAPQT